MKITEFIDKVDYEGGLWQAYKYGLDPSEIDADTSAEIKLQDILTSAWAAFDNAAEFEDEYYTMVETGEF